MYTLRYRSSSYFGLQNVKILKIHVYDIMMLDTFPKAFSKGATSLGYFPQWQLPECAISHVPLYTLAAVLGPPL